MEGTASGTAGRAGTAAELGAGSAVAAPDDTAPHQSRAVADLTQLEGKIRQGRYQQQAQNRPKLVQLPDGKGGRVLTEVGGGVPDPVRVAARQPSHLSYADLSVLEDAAPALAAAAWERIREAARQAVETGHHAAEAVEGPNASPYTRALFLEIRADLVRQWLPTGAVERMLIDNLTQAYVLHNRWLGIAMDYQELPDLGHKDRYPDESLDEYADRKRAQEEREREEQYYPPRMTTAQATDRALELAEKFEKAVARGIRALRDLRRFSGPMNISAGQVNIAAGHQQVNVRQDEAVGG